MGDVIITDNSEKVLDALQAAVEKALEMLGQQAEGYAKMQAPVDTGNLRNSISHAIDDNSAYIGTNVEYAAYQELGTRYTRAHPYLKPAVTDHTAEYKRIVESVLKGG